MTKILIMCGPDTHGAKELLEALSSAYEVEESPADRVFEIKAPPRINPPFFDMDKKGRRRGQRKFNKRFRRTP